MADYQVEAPINPCVVLELIEEGKALLAAPARYLDEHPGPESDAHGDG